MNRGVWRCGIVAGFVITAAGLAGGATVEERLAALEARMEQQASEREAALVQRIKQLEEQVSVLSEGGRPAPDADGTEGSMAARMGALEEQVDAITARQDANPLEGVTLGGYGELHYNALRGSGGAANKRELDFHRFVLMVGKDFNERVRFRSEFELEHALSGDDAPGEVELEQAYVDFDLNDRHTARGGVFLLPVGLINANHEPTRFNGVERNPVESYIIPTTWWEGGAGMYGQLTDTLRYDAYVHSGLKTSSADKYAVRPGRQKVAGATASDPAATVALNWSVPGVTLGGSVQYQSDVTQGVEDDAVQAMFGEVHADLKKGRWGLRMLYAQWNLDGDGPEAIGADRQFGWYLEPYYCITDTVTAFVRYNQWDNRAGGSAESGKEQVNAGVNWNPHEQVVVKADYQWQMNEDGKDQNGLNLGLGYEF